MAKAVLCVSSCLCAFVVAFQTVSAGGGIGYHAGRVDFLGELQPWSKYLAVRSFVYLGRELRAVQADRATKAATESGVAWCRWIPLKDRSQPDICTIHGFPVAAD